jgi:2-C-methyl-D-erythritol 4-phosphate cytidylyltransferase
MADSKKYAVIVAGGKGARMGGPIPKQFLPFLGKPLLCYAIEAFSRSMPGIKLVLVLPTDQLKSAEIVLKSYIGGIDVIVVEGGETRFHSVQNGLKQIKNDGVVFIHDGARPLISHDLIHRCYRQALDKGSAVPAVPVSESVRMLNGENGSSPVDREQLRIIQTPQTFRTELILPAFQQEYRPSFTDEATVVESHGTPIFLIDGIRDNIKITIPEDLIIAEVLLKTRANLQV